MGKFFNLKKSTCLYVRQWKYEMFTVTSKTYFICFHKTSLLGGSRVYKKPGGGLTGKKVEVPPYLRLDSGQGRSS